MFREGIQSICLVFENKSGIILYLELYLYLISIFFLSTIVIPSIVVLIAFVSFFMFVSFFLFLQIVCYLSYWFLLFGFLCFTIQVFITCIFVLSLLRSWFLLLLFPFQSGFWLANYVGWLTLICDSCYLWLFLRLVCQEVCDDDFGCFRHLSRLCFFFHFLFHFLSCSFFLFKFSFVCYKLLCFLLYLKHHVIA